MRGEGVDHMTSVKPNGDLRFLKFLAVVVVVVVVSEVFSNNGYCGSRKAWFLDV